MLPESAVINEYLEERYPEPRSLALGPRRARRRPSPRRALRRNSAAPIMPFAAGKRTPASDSPLQLAGLDSLLAGRPFLTGLEFGLADAAYLPWILRAESTLGVDLESHPARRRLVRPSRASVPRSPPSSLSGGAMNIRPATDADRPVLEELVPAYLDEHWARPYSAAAARPLPRGGRDRRRRGRRRGRRDGQGRAAGGPGPCQPRLPAPEARGQGGGRDLLRDLTTHFREQGVEHVSLNVELPNDEALAYWRRLGFTDYRRSLLTDLESLEQRLAGGEAPSTGSVHVQTDDQAAVEKAVVRFAPRVARTRRRWSRRRRTAGSASTTRSPARSPTACASSPRSSRT